LSQPNTVAGNAFIFSEIVLNEAEHLSAIVIRPGINQNGYSYSLENIRRFATQLTSVPLVKDHSDKIEDNIGRWLKPDILSDGSLKGAFQISQTEEKILGKIKDGTIRYTSSAHTYGDRSYCTVCNATIPPKSLCRSHKLGKLYDGKIAGLGFENPNLLHVSLVQNPADLSCAILNNLGSLLADKVENLSASILESEAQHTNAVAELQKVNANVASELKTVKDELEKYRRLKFAEPPAKIKVTAAPPLIPAEKQRKESWLGEDDR
jgi:hypothetical protein